MSFDLKFCVNFFVKFSPPLTLSYDFRFRPFDFTYFRFVKEDRSRKVVRARIFTTRVFVQIKQELVILKTIAACKQRRLKYMNKYVGRQ